MMPFDWRDYHIVDCGISGGKDSQAAATWLVKDSGCPTEKINLSFCDTGNEHQWTYDHIRQIEKWLNVEIRWLRDELDFYQLAARKKRFPSAKARFCTDHLKMQISQKLIKRWMDMDLKVLLITGIRRQESEARKNLPAFDFDTYYACDVYRPLIDWNQIQVFEYIKNQGQYANPLYSMGAQRVGCFPCVMSRKHEIRMIADQFPERIEMIREQEISIGSSFFGPNITPKRFRRSKFSRNGIDYKLASIDDVVDWSHTNRKGEYDSGPQMSIFDDEPLSCANITGACE
jgi:3'-phosphoadenosine 5'-phosphosulfate sulfotransferase (PAPS reductase)/FAD synthetase